MLKAILIALGVIVVAWVAAGILSDKIIARRIKKEQEAQRKHPPDPPFLPLS